MLSNGKKTYKHVGDSFDCARQCRIGQATRFIAESSRDVVGVCVWGSERLGEREEGVRGRA
ncbi:hypothetical protein GCM10009558_011990 [Virgisporangium aurantiacum]